MNQNSYKDVFDRQIEETYEKLDALLKRMGGSGEAASVAAEALEELSTTLEELHAASEELSSQNEALAAAQMSVEAERQRYRDLFEFAPDGYVATDNQGVIQEANQSASNLLHVSGRRLAGKPLAIFVAETDRKEFRNVLSKLQAKPGPGPENWRIDLQARQGKTFPVSITVDVASNATVATGIKNEPTGLRWMLHDISARKKIEAELEKYRLHLEELVEERTVELKDANAQLEMEIVEREQAEAELQASEGRLRLALKNAPVAISMQDRNLRITYAYNQRTMESAEIIGKTDEDIFTPADAQMMKALKRRVLKSGTELREQVWLDRNGTQKYLDLYIEPIKDERGAVTGIGVASVDLTELKLAEQALQESEEKAKKQAAELDSIISSLPDAITIYDKFGRIVRTNKLSDEFVSYPQADKSKPINERTPQLQVLDMRGQPVEPQDRPAQRALGGELVKGEILQIIHNPDEPMWITSSAAPVYKDGELTGAVAIVTDITRLRQTEEALRQSEEHFRLALKNAPVTVATQDRNLVFQWAFNQRTVPVEQILGKTDHDLFPPEDAERLIALKRKVLETGREVSEKLWVTSGGKRVFLDLLLEPLRDNSGNVNGVGIATIDLTQTKLAEAALEAARAEAEDQKKRLEAILEVLPVGMAILDSQGGTVSSNREFEAVWGGPTPPTRAVSDYSAYKAWWVDSGKAVQPEEWASGLALSRGEAVTGQTVRIERFDGTEAFVLNSAAPVFDAGGSVNGCVVAIQDISERMRAEKELQRLNRTLRALSNINQAMMRSTDEAGYMDEVCQIVVNDCGHAMTWIGMAKEDEGRSVQPVASAGFEAGYLETLKITWADTERGRGPTGTAIRTGEVSLCRNMLTDPKFKPWRKEALKRGYASSIVLPLISSGKAFGAITIYSRDADPFTEAEIELLDELAGDLAYGITMIRTRFAHELAQAALRESEERFKQLADASFEGLVIHADGVMLDVNARLSDMVGYDPAELIGKPFWDYIEPKYHDLVGENVVKGYTGLYEVELIHKDGQDVPVEVVGRALQWKGRQARVSALRDISERKRAEKTLYRQAQMLDLSYEAIFAWELDGVITSWNKGAEQLYGYSYEEAIGKVSHQLLRTVHPQGIDTIKANLLRDITWTGELEHITKDGRKILVESRLQLLGDEPGTQIVLETNRNITERKRVEAALRESEQKYRSLVKYAPAGIYEVDFSTGRFTEVNDVMSQILGYGREELLAMTAFDIMDDEAKALFAARLRQAQTSDEPAPTTEYRVRTKDGRLIWALLNITFHRKDGKIVGATVIANDITERRQAEEALRQSEQKYSILFEKGSIAASLTKLPEVTFADVNEAFEKLLGWTKEEVVGKTSLELGMARPEEHSLTVEEVKRRGFQNEAEKHIRTKSGQERIVLLNVGTVEFNGIQYTLSTLQDITERKQMEVELRVSEERFRNITESLPVLISLTTTDDSTIAFTNTAYNEAFGFRKEEIIGRKGPDVYYNVAERDKMLDTIREQGSIHNYSLKARKSDGTPIWLLSSVLPTIYDGKPAILGASIDITKSIEAEQARQKSEERYRNLFDTMEEGFCIIEMVFDPQGKPVDYRFLEINPAFEKQSGLHEAKGKLMRELAPDQEDFWFETYGKIALTGEAMRFENEARALGRWFEVFAYRVDEPESRKVAILFNDITERRKSDEAIQTTLQRFYNILASMYTGLLLVTDDGQVEFANQAFCDYFYLKDSPADLAGQASADILKKIGPAYLHPDEALGRIREIVERGEPVKGETVAMQDGCELLRDFIPIRINGKSTGRLWHHTDITERKRKEADLKAANEELTRFNKAMTGRELRMIELKKEVNALCELAGQPLRYSQGSGLGMP